MKRSHRRPCHNSFRSPYAEQFEVRQLLSAVSAVTDPAAIDGTGNNVDNSDMGSTDVQLIRIADSEYANGVSAPAGEDRPSAREISNAVAAQTESVENDRNLTDYIWIWGQFLDHDIDLSEGAEPEEEFNIEVPAGDVFFDPFGTGEVEISLNRTVYEDGDDGVREQINQITAFIDGSVVYGSDQERADALRTFEGGLLKTSDGDLLPFNVDGLSNAGGTSDTLYLAGDVRANENVALTSMHTLFVREHNRIATELAAENPNLTDEDLYQQARAIVRAQLQVITYNEFLPALLGPDALSEYTGYDPTVNPNIANEFSTAAYRFGHSLLSPELQRLDADGNVIEDGNLSLQDAFFNPGEVAEQGIDSILRGAATQLAQELDTQIIDDVRNFLFGPPGAGGLDLASLNIQRGRDHGLADYNDTRVALGLAPVTSFEQISSNPEVALALEQTYGSVDEIDLWVGGLAEDHLDGASLGETFTSILVDQFERLRDGDRYWYENVFSGRQLRELENATLADIIERNTDVQGLQENVFFQRGMEVVHVDTHREGTDNIRVRVREGRVEVVDGDRGRVIVSRPADEMAGLEITGADGIRERFSVDATLADAASGMSVSIDGGRGRGDTLAVQGTRSDDVMTAAGDGVSVNDLDIAFMDVEMLVLEGRDGDDVLDATASNVQSITLDGGRGDDTLLGSNGDDRMFGGDGRDRLRGGDGNDTMSGGRGNDRVYGQRGRDRLNGGEGNDLVMQDGNGDRRENMPRLAAFMQDSLQIRTAGNYFENWGGLGEKWVWSNQGWLFITPDGTLYRWDGGSGASGEVVAELGTEVFADPTALVQRSRNPIDDDTAGTVENIAIELSSRRSFRLTGNLFENWAGLGERWIWGSGQWYFITPDGLLYEYDSNADGIPGNLVAELSPEYFNDPSRLTRRRR